MKKIVLGSVVLFLFMSCIQRNYTETVGPSKNESKRLIAETLKAIAADPKSVNVWSTDVAVYSPVWEGWIVPCDFSWTGLHGVLERNRWYFSIAKGNIGIVDLLENQEELKLFWEERSPNIR